MRVFYFFMYRTDFIITASCDGHLKFWKKQENVGIEFVKHFRCHLGKSLCLSGFSLVHIDLVINWKIECGVLILLGHIL